MKGRMVMHRLGFISMFVSCILFTIAMMLTALEFGNPVPVWIIAIICLVIGLIITMTTKKRKPHHTSSSVDTEPPSYDAAERVRQLCNINRTAFDIKHYYRPIEKWPAEVTDISHRSDKTGQEGNEHPTKRYRL